MLLAAASVNPSVMAKDDFKLIGHKSFVRHNPMSDRFSVKKFDHVEFWCGDATNTYKRFSWGLGMGLVAKSDMTTGNQTYCSYAIRSDDLVFAFTAPYSYAVEKSGSLTPHPAFDIKDAQRFFSSHGLGVRAVGLLVENAADAFNKSVENGALPALEPKELVDQTTGGVAHIAEVKLYGDVVLRYVSKESYDGPFLPNYEPVDSMPMSIGISRLDHAVGNVHNLEEAVAYVAKFTGFHRFAEFTAEDVGTEESGLNSMVLANNNEMVLVPMNEPVFGTKRKSQIQTYLEHNEGPGLQHLALMCSDIFHTLKEMRNRSYVGGFEFMPKPPPTYYKNLRKRAADILTEKQMEDCEDLGILVDRDDQGVLLQIFTKPLGDRPTIFIEIIQRIGCMVTDSDGKQYQKGGCGGFGKGNFSELFKSIEEYEKTLERRIAV
eukprot:TRINITY_DN1086_c0_g1_i1.p1 TRINITY_DN1086_c0_g1~~TRINITY_DN1086_c0_g1_i1.p1  ORF type:complete len:434 (+),score=30.41 TRINITY_DN1086_c0_g1_i1:57-1358(+)